MPAHRRVTVPVIALAFLAGSALRAQTGPQVVTFTSSADGSRQPYALYIPRTFDPAKTYPLVVSLHSEDSNERLNLTQILGLASRYGLPATIGTRGFPPLRDVPYIVVCPLARGTLGYQGLAEHDVYDAIADVERRYPVDPDRVFLTGISMGGGGALWLAATRPDVWAGVAALCAETIPGTEDLAPNLLDLPVRLFHGNEDTVVPAASSRAWQRRLLDAAVPVRYFEYPLVRHNAWDLAYARGGALDWFPTLRRERSPARVHFVTHSYEYNSAYWLRIDGLTPGQLASIDARRDAAGKITVTARNLEGFTITEPAGEVARVDIDGTEMRLRRGAALSFSKSAAGWRQELWEPGGKHKGAEGPIVAAVWSRHIYVYGTLGTRTADDVDRRRAVAQAAAHWTTLRSRLALELPVKADTEITPADMESANLVLFGTAATDAVIAGIAGRLPLTMRPDAADYGLLFIVPNGKHYVLINSGLPWWTGAEELRGGAYSQAPAQFRLLSSLGDYVLYRGSMANVVAQGRFDANWKVPPEAAAQIAATGTVTIP